MSAAFNPEAAHDSRQAQPRDAKSTKRKASDADDFAHIARRAKTDEAQSSEDVRAETALDARARALNLQRAEMNARHLELSEREMALREIEGELETKSEALGAREAELTLREQSFRLRAEHLDRKEARAKENDAIVKRNHATVKAQAALVRMQMEEVKSREARVVEREMSLVRWLDDVCVEDARATIRPELVAVLRKRAAQEPVPSSGQATCSICLEAPVDCMAQTCGHARFCCQCIELWEKEKNTCPHCRVETKFRFIYT